VNMIDNIGGEMTKTDQKEIVEIMVKK